MVEVKEQIRIGDEVLCLDEENDFYGREGVVIDDDGIEPLICLVKYDGKWGSWHSSGKLRAKGR